MIWYWATRYQFMMKIVKFRYFDNMNNCRINYAPHNIQIVHYISNFCTPWIKMHRILHVIHWNYWFYFIYFVPVRIAVASFIWLLRYTHTRTVVMLIIVRAIRNDSSFAADSKLQESNISNSSDNWGNCESVKRLAHKHIYTFTLVWTQDRFELAPKENEARVFSIWWHKYIANILYHKAHTHTSTQTHAHKENHSDSKQDHHTARINGTPKFIRVVA